MYMDKEFDVLQLNETWDLFSFTKRKKTYQLQMGVQVEI